MPIYHGLQLAQTVDLVSPSRKTSSTCKIDSILRNRFMLMFCELRSSLESDC